MLTPAVPLPAGPRRLVILGAGGFLGRALRRQAQEAGIATFPMARAEVDLAAEGAGDRLAGLLRPDDCVVVLAAVTPDRDRGRAAFMVNIRIGDAVARAVERAGPAHVVYIGSDAVYAFGDATPITERTAAAPADLYGAMHLAREMMLATTGMPLAILRSTMLYGVDDTHNAYGPNRFLRQAEREGRISLFGAGEELRDALSVDDAAQLVWRVVRDGRRGLLNLASGQSITQAAMAKHVAACFATPVRIDSMPRQIPITHRQFDITAIRQAFPDFAFTPLDEGLARAVRR